MLVSAIAIGLVAGLVRGGHISNLAAFRVRWPLVLAAGAVLRVAGLALPLPLVAYVAGLGLIGAAALANTQYLGSWFVAAGAFLNLVVVLANGAMPVDAGAAAAAGATVIGNDRLHVITSAETRLAPLADVIPVPLFRGVYSVGDVVIAVGAVLIGYRATRP